MSFWHQPRSRAGPSPAKKPITRNQLRLLALVNPTGTIAIGQSATRALYSRGLLQIVKGRYAITPAGEQEIRKRTP